MSNITPEEVQFVQAMRDKHRQNVEDFGVPDQLVEESDVRLFRFRGAFEAQGNGAVYMNPMMVYSFESEKPVGSCNVYPLREGTNWFEVIGSIDYGTFERLEFQVGKPVFAIPSTVSSGMYIQLMTSDSIPPEFWDKSTAIVERE